MIALTPVLRSSNITGVAFDSANRILAMAFLGGSTWHYRDVPPEVGDVMMQVVQQANVAVESGLALDADETPSVGRFFAAKIKKQYDAEKIETA